MESYYNTMTCVTSSQEWNPHFFVLTPSKLYYTDETTFNKQREEEDDDVGTSAPTTLEVQIIYFNFTLDIRSIKTLFQWYLET